MEHRTPEWEDQECFEGHLNEEQLGSLEKQDPRREIKTALMLSQLSQGVDFSIGWIKLLVSNVRSLELDMDLVKSEQVAALQKRCDEQNLEIDRLKTKIAFGQWLVVIVLGAALIEIVRKWFH